MFPLDALVTELRARAVQQRVLGAEAQARTLEWCATWLLERVTDWENECLTLDEAVEESGYSYSTIQQKVAAGDIPNSGAPHRPRVRRGDLPKKGPRRRFKLESGEPDLAEEVLAAKL